MDSDRCAKCGRSRVAGWVLVKGRCLDCGPEEFRQRREELRRQAERLVDPDAGPKEAA